jgi:hypothetical protein
MIGVGGGLVIHADGKRVSIDVISDVIGAELADAALFSVYRYQRLSPQASAEIVKAAYRYYSQSYGFIPYFGSVKIRPRRREDTTQFCSRLVAHAYRCAGYSLTTLADARVLPLDLYRICQSDEWRDVTAEFIEEGFSPDVEHALAGIGMEEICGMNLQDFLKRSGQTMREASALQRDFLHMQHKSLRDRLHVEGLLSQYVSLQFDLAKATRIAPDSMDEPVTGWVEKVLAQLPALLDLAALPDVGLLVAPSPERLMIAGEETNDLPTFVGLPAPAVVQQMRCASETVRIYAYLLLAELGMSVIATQFTQDVRFQPFRDIGIKYAKAFLAVVPVVDDLPARLSAASKGFLWVESESDRETCRGLCDTVIKLLQATDLFRRHNTS